jgi:ribosomal protein S6--L-glutamate ligase
MVRIAILSTRTARYHPNRRLLEAGRSLGHRVTIHHPRKVLLETRAAQPASGSEEFPEVFLPRIGSTIEDHELAAVFHLERMGIPAINGFDALVVSRDKFLSLRQLERAGIPVPRTHMVTDASRLESTIDALGGFPVIMKAPRGRQGLTVYRVDGRNMARYILEHPPGPIAGVIVQEYIPSAAQGDVRIVVIGGRVVASMRRIPKRGDFRSNVHLRGRGVPWDPEDRWVNMAAEASAALGLHVAGVDLLEGGDGPVVLEVNTTPGFRELERVTGVDVAGEIVRHAVNMATRR